VTRVRPDALTPEELFGWSVVRTVDSNASSGGDGGDRPSSTPQSTTSSKEGGRTWRDGCVSSFLRASAAKDAAAAADVEETLSARSQAPSSTEPDTASLHMDWLVFDGGDGSGATTGWEDGVYGLLEGLPAVSGRGDARPANAASLQLPTGERLHGSASLRVLFETTDISQASPATIARCGVLHLHQQVGWCHCFVSRCIRGTCVRWCDVTMTVALCGATYWCFLMITMCRRAGGGVAGRCRRVAGSRR
jgi:hypothetical protein